MEQINTYSIARLQKAFELATKRSDYFFVDARREPIITDEPFRAETYSITLLKEGTLNLQTDLAQHQVKGSSVITIAPTVTRSFRRSNDNPEIDLLFFTDNFLLETHSNIFYLAKYHFFENNDMHVLPLDEAGYNRVKAVFDMIKTTFNKEHPNEAVLMRSYTYLLIHEIDALHRSGEPISKLDETSSQFINFRNLLTKEFWRHRSVGFYANSLNVTPKYLSEVIKRQTGKTAGEWIDKAVILEAKVLLQKQDLGIAQISDKLNFGDQSIFGKFFKTHEGVSPLEYRKRLKS
ncbi:MAG: helix-turn-helix domain-containing protein [Bacteroidota bacterium]|nr:helix-turn-helix domain-containing protein [Bacteroidota bacterium]